MLEVYLLLFAFCLDARRARCHRFPVEVEIASIQIRRGLALEPLLPYDPRACLSAGRRHVQLSQLRGATVTCKLVHILFFWFTVLLSFLFCMICIISS